MIKTDKIKNKIYFVSKEVVDEDAKVKYQKFRLPSLSRPSLYHEVGEKIGQSFQNSPHPTRRGNFCHPETGEGNHLKNVLNLCRMSREESRGIVNFPCGGYGSLYATLCE